MGRFSKEVENVIQPSSEDGNRGSSTSSNSATSRTSTGRTTVSYPIISGINNGSLEEVVESNPFYVEEDELIEVESSIDWNQPPRYDLSPRRDDQSKVTASLRNEGLKSSNLIVAIDFTLNNDWTGKFSFNNKSLHAIGDTPNPYEKAISIIGKTLAPLDEDNLIPCFGFGDVTTCDRKVFSFHIDHLPCHGLKEVLSCYRKVVPNVQLSGPTSYAPVVEAAIDTVVRGGQDHVLLIISTGQVTRSVNTSDEELRRLENESIKSIVDASSYPLSIVLVGVGDGPWEDMKKFADKLPARKFNNFQFVNFTEIMSKSATPLREETDIPLAALMELPLRHKAAIELGILGRVTGRAQKIIPLPPPVPCTNPLPTQELINYSLVMTCNICFANKRDTAFSCGHMICECCASKVSICPICRLKITKLQKVFL